MTKQYTLKQPSGKLIKIIIKKSLNIMLLALIEDFCKEQTI